MKALTIHQPWASAIVLGSKTIENRTWHPHKDVVGEFIAIHASQRYDVGADLSVRNIDGDAYREHGRGNRGCVVGVARVVCSRRDRQVMPCNPCNPWWVGPIGWLLEGRTALERRSRVAGTRACGICRTTWRPKCSRSSAT